MGELKPVRLWREPDDVQGWREMVRNAGSPSGAHWEATAIAEAYRACAAAVVKRATATLEVAAERSSTEFR